MAADYTRVINESAMRSFWRLSGNILGMIVWLKYFLGWLGSAFCTREVLFLENLAAPAPPGHLRQTSILDSNIPLPDPAA